MKVLRERCDKQTISCGEYLEEVSEKTTMKPTKLKKQPVFANRAKAMIAFT